MQMMMHQPVRAPKILATKCARRSVPTTERLQEIEAEERAERKRVEKQRAKEEREQERAVVRSARREPIREPAMAAAACWWPKQVVGHDMLLRWEQSNAYPKNPEPTINGRQATWAAHGAGYYASVASQPLPSTDITLELQVKVNDYTYAYVGFCDAAWITTYGGQNHHVGDRGSVNSCSVNISDSVARCNGAVMARPSSINGKLTHGKLLNVTIDLSVTDETVTFRLSQPSSGFSSITVASLSEMHIAGRENNRLAVSGLTNSGLAVTIVSGRDKTAAEVGAEQQLAVAASSSSLPSTLPLPLASLFAQQRACRRRVASLLSQQESLVSELQREYAEESAVAEKIQRWSVEAAEAGGADTEAHSSSPSPAHRGKRKRTTERGADEEEEASNSD